MKLEVGVEWMHEESKRIHQKRDAAFNEQLSSPIIGVQLHPSQLMIYMTMDLSTKDVG